MYSATKKVDEQVARKIPEPTGYKLLIKPLEVKEKTDTGVYMPDSLKQAETTASVLGLLLKLAPTAIGMRKDFLMAHIAKRVILLYFGLILAQGLRLINKSFV